MQHHEIYMKHDLFTNVATKSFEISKSKYIQRKFRCVIKWEHLILPNPAILNGKVSENITLNVVKKAFTIKIPSSKAAGVQGRKIQNWLSWKNCR